MANNNNLNAIPVGADPPNVPAPLNPVGPIGVADPARNLVAERDQAAARERAQAQVQRPRFEARRMHPIPRREVDPNLDTQIFTAATGFPYDDFRFPALSAYIPCASVLMYLLHYMDHTMASTKRWTDNCMGWAPPYSMIYISMLFYIQVIRAMDAAGAISAASELNALLREFTRHFPLEDLWIPGPLVQFFKNLACFWPSADDLYGNVTPTLPASPGWSRTSRYRFGNDFVTHLPNISFFISRLRTICTTATRDLMNETTFFNDVDGPRFCATLFNQRCNHGAAEIANMRSPGAGFVLSGDLRLWQQAAARLDLNGIPIDLDAGANVAANNLPDTWTSALRMALTNTYFGPVSGMMAKYCQFWKGSQPLSSCAPNCSAAGGVKCVTEVNTDLFDDIPWSAPTGTHNHQTHGNANQLGHYVLQTNRNLEFLASTTIRAIPLHHWYAAITYCHNLLIAGTDEELIRTGEFWNAVPDVHGRAGISTTQGVLSSIVRTFHSDVRIDPSRQ